MSKIISIHSFRGGTGKSNITANLGYCLASRGKKVCIVDTDVQSPGIHVPLRLENSSKATLNDYLFKSKRIEEVAVDISKTFDLNPNTFYLIPSSIKTNEIARILKEGYSITTLANGFREINAKLHLDYLLIDTHPGLNEETLLSIAMSNILFIIMRPDEQDIQGTSVTIEVARKLTVEKTEIIINMVPPSYDLGQVRTEVESKFNCNVIEVLPHTYKLTELGSKDLLCRCLKNEIWAQKIINIVESFDK